MSTRIGNLSQPLGTEGKVERWVDRNGNHATETYHVDRDYDIASAGNIGTVSQTYGVPLQEVRLKQEGKHATLTLSYGPDDPSNPSGGGSGTADPVQEISLGTESVPLSQIQNAYLPAALVTLKQQDPTKQVPMFFLEYRYTTWTSNFSFSESSLLSYVGVQGSGTPPSISGATASKWHKAGLQVRKQSGTIEKSEVWHLKPWQVVS